MSDIQTVLGHFDRDCQPSDVAPLGAAGGLSGAQFSRIVAPRGTLVLRRWPVEHPSPDGLRFIHDVLRHAADRRIGFLPVPISTAGGDTFVRHDGHLWELASWLPGTANYEQSPSREKLQAAMTALAEFHNTVADFPTTGGRRPSGSGPRSSPATAPAVVTRLARLRELQPGGGDVLARAIDDSHWPELAPLARQFMRLMPRALPTAIAQLAPLADVRFRLQPCIRDIWHDHVLFDGDRVTGLIDFGAMQFDTPVTDLARLLGSLVGDDLAQWTDGLAAYAATRPLSDTEVTAVRALDTSGTILAGANWIKWVYLDRRNFESREQVLTRFQRIAARQEKLLA